LAMGPPWIVDRDGYAVAGSANMRVDGSDSVAAEPAACTVRGRSSAAGDAPSRARQIIRMLCAVRAQGGLARRKIGDVFIVVRIAGMLRRVLVSLLSSRHFFLDIRSHYSVGPVSSPVSSPVWGCPR
jgi:hypothetical protein